MNDVRYILCEGPDDLIALREIAIGVFGAISVPQKAASAGAGGADRKASLTIGDSLKIEIVAARSGKTSLLAPAAVKIKDLPALAPNDPLADRLTHVAVVFDPDGDDRGKFENELVEHVRGHAIEWAVADDTTPHRWLAERSRDGGYRVALHTIAWRADAVKLDDLPDLSNLERVLCGIAARAYPDHAKVVDRWLVEMNAATRSKQPWKSALHLWCALVEPKAEESSAPARFLHQNKDCRPHVEAALEESGLLDELRPVFSPPPTAP